MKIVKKSKAPQPDKGESKVGGIIKLCLSGVGIIAAFSVILSMLMNYASPNKYVTATDIEQQMTIVESEGGEYIGHLIESTYEGEGQFQYIAGGVYTGEFADSERSGTGIFEWPNGDIFSGSWVDDQMVEGTYMFSSGASYTGTFTDNQFDTGSYDLGEAALDKGYKSFIAEIVGGEIDSVDFLTTDGLDYDGEINGQAVIIYPSGNQYSGDVKNGVRNGDGKFKWVSDGTVTASYDGNWKDGVMSGKGSYHYSSNSYPYITGTFVNGKPDGTAIYYKESGNTFSTTWSNGSCTSVKES